MEIIFSSHLALLAVKTKNMYLTYSSLRAQRRFVSVPYFLRVSESSEYSLSARLSGIPSHTKMRTTITADSQVWPARSRTKQSSFSSVLLLRITCIPSEGEKKKTRFELRGVFFGGGTQR